MNDQLKTFLLDAQTSEITEYHIYRRLAQRQKDLHNRDVLERIACDESRHYEFWARHTRQKPQPRQWTVWRYTCIARLLGVTFAIKLMERGEEHAQANYERVIETIPEAADIMRDEQEHEQELMNLIDEERLRYVGSIVLGLNDALVELTGALAGFTLALQKTKLIAVIGLITGIAAALSMATSEYLSTKTDDADLRSPAKASLYTGLAYIATVFALVCPYFLFPNPLLALSLTLTAALVIIFAFTYYLSVARDLPFIKRFAEMAGLSLGVTAISFAIGYLLRVFVGVDV